MIRSPRQLLTRPRIAETDVYVSLGYYSRASYRDADLINGCRSRSSIGNFIPEPTGRLGGIA